MNFKEIKLKESKHLMRFAWGLEITFCIIGLAAAFSLTMQGIQGSEYQSVFHPSVLVGFLALGAIAFVELLKIPTMKGILLSKSMFTKFFGIIFLIGACLITFETMSTGLEQNITNRETKIDEARIIVDDLNENIVVLNNKIESIGSKSDSEIREEIDNGLQIALATMNDDIENLRKREQEIRSNLNSTEVNELLRQASSLEQSKEQKTSLYQANLNQINQELLKLNEDEQTQLSDAFLKGSIIQKFADRRDAIKAEKALLKNEYDASIKSIDRKITTLNNKIAKLSEPDAKTSQELNAIGKDIAKLIKDKNKLILDANKKSEALLTIAAKNDVLIAELNVKKSLLETDLASARNQLANEAKHSFIHRIALKISSADHAADLTIQEVGNVAMFFVVSIAVIIACSGPLITFLAMRNMIEEYQPRKSKVRPAIRRTLVVLRKKLMEPKIVKEIEEVVVEKEVIKEIPVEKEVYKKVEVPVPYEITKYVGVPVPTETKDLPVMPEINGKGLDKLIQGGKAA